MSFSGNENHDIDLATASEWTANYRNSNPDAIKGHYFGKKAIESILSQEGVVGIRIYYGLNDIGEKQLIITGVDSDENDLYNGQLAERSLKCPPNCSSNNPLNS